MLKKSICNCRYGILVIMAATYTGCGTVAVHNLENSVDCTVLGTTPTFASSVVPLFASTGCSASSCHTGSTPAGELNLGSSLTSTQLYDALIASGALNVTTDPADPLNSVLLAKPLKGMLPHEGGDNFSSLNDTSYQTIYCWIESGASNN